MTSARRVWKNSFLSRQVQVAHVGIKQINIRGIVHVISSAVRAYTHTRVHVCARTLGNARYSLCEIKRGECVPPSPILHAISQPRCALIHTFVFPLPRRRPERCEIRLLITVRAGRHANRVTHDKRNNRTRLRAHPRRLRPAITPLIDARIETRVFNYRERNDSARERKEKNIISP